MFLGLRSLSSGPCLGPHVPPGNLPAFPDSVEHAANRHAWRLEFTVRKRRGAQYTRLKKFLYSRPSR